MQNKIVSDLIGMRDENFAKFNSGIIPTTESKLVIGVRTPQLKRYAKTISDTDKFLSKLPHTYFEENQIHAFILCDIRDFAKCVQMVDAFLPYVDNWATCDHLIPKSFAKNVDKLLPWVQKWIKSKHTYTVRFAIGILMRYFLGQNFDKKYAKMVATVSSDEYYINMMRAWYFATALAKNWDDVICFIEAKELDTWTHNKTIQKSIESFRITPAHKKHLGTLRS